MRVSRITNDDHVFAAIPSELGFGINFGAEVIEICRDLANNAHFRLRKFSNPFVVRSPRNSHDASPFAPWEGIESCIHRTSQKNTIRDYIDKSEGQGIARVCEISLNLGDKVKRQVLFSFRANFKDSVLTLLLAAIVIEKEGEHTLKNIQHDDKKMRT
jgi:hypothetical protein